MNDGMIDGQPELGQEGDDPRDLIPQEPDESKIAWFAKKGSGFLDELHGKQDAYFQSAQQRGLLTQWIISYAALHGLDPDSMSTLQTQNLGFDGDEAEFLRLCINVYRPYVQRQVTSVLSQAPVLKCVSQNTDAKNQIGAKIGDNIVNSIFKRSTEGQRLRDMVIASTFASSSFGHMVWNKQGGDVVTVKKPVPGPDGQPLIDPNSGKPATYDTKQKSGMPECRVGYPWTVFQEPDEQDTDTWRAIRVNDNRWNLMATYAPTPQPDANNPMPEDDPNADLREKIRTAPANSDEYDFSTLFGFKGMSSENKDSVTTIHFYYPRSVAMPSGRYTISLGDIILHDSDCPVTEGVPIAEMCPARFIETTFGYAPAWDMLSIQQSLNQIVSDQLSNLATFGRQSVAMEKGTEITVDALASGQKGFFYNQGGKPPAAVLMNDIGTGPTVLQKYLHMMLDVVSGQNSASRGDPEANVTSGTFAALLHTVASEFMSYAQESTDAAIERIANIGLDMVRLYGTPTFLVESVGIEDRTYVQEYSQEDIAGFRGVLVETISPYMRNIAGRLDMHDKLKDYAPEDRAAAYSLITTGRSDEFMRKDRNSALYIQRENEWLITGETKPITGPNGQPMPKLDPMGQPLMGPDGMPVPDTLPKVQRNDNHKKHIPEHDAAISGLLASDNPDMEAVRRLQAHNDDHAYEWGHMHPFICSFLNIPIPPPQPGTESFKLSVALAQGQLMIAMAGQGAQPQPMADNPQPQPGQAGSMQPKTAKSSAQPGGPGGDNSAGAAQPGGSGVDSSGVKLPPAAQPPASAQQQA